MAIKSLYKDYFQKSRVFLYPALGIKMGNSIVPKECYITWEGKYSIEDKKVVCVYYLRSDKEFKFFENKFLLGNSLFDNFFELEDGLGAYVFDFKSFNDDIINFSKGKYSKLSPELKKKIIKFYAQSVKYTHVHSFLYPNMYFGLYSDLLGVSKDILVKVGELCNPPELDKENLIASVKDLQISKLTV
jgi:hypothetical protein